MQVNRIAVGLMAAGILATISGCPKPVTEPTTARNGSGPALPNSHAGSRGDAPVTSSGQEPRAQDLPRQAGIGIALRIEDGKVLVADVLPNTPAARSNSIKKDDQIVAVADGNEEPVDVTKTKDVASVVGMIRGPILRNVRLTIVPTGKGDADRLVVSLIRGDIKEIDSFIDGRLLPLGAKAPNFKFARLDDAGEADLSQLAGRIVVIELWASWCGPCITSVDELASLQERHPEWIGHVELLAASVDETKEDAAMVFNRKHWSKISTVWAGPDVLKIYRIGGLPTLFVIDSDGIVAAVDHRLDVSGVIKQLLPEAVEEADSR